AAQLLSRSAAADRLLARVLRLRKARRRQNLHRRAVRQAEAEGVYLRVAACAARAASALRESSRELRRADRPRRDPRALRARLAARAGRTSALAVERRQRARDAH